MKKAAKPGGVRQAVCTPAAWYLNCPACGEALDHPTSGSQMWVCDESMPETLACRCGQVVMVPLKVR